MSALKGISLAALKTAIGEQPVISEGWLGGRKLELRDEKGLKLAKVSLNAIVRKLKKELADGRYECGSEICQKVINLNGHEVSGFVKKMLTLFRRTLSHLIKGNPKEKIAFIKASFDAMASNKADPLLPGKPALKAEEPSNVSAGPFIAPIRVKEVLQEKSQALIAAFLGRDEAALQNMLEDSFIKEILTHRDSLGNTVLHHLAMQLPLGYEREHHDKWLTAIKNKGADINARNSSGESPDELARETIATNNLPESAKNLINALLPVIETLSFDLEPPSLDPEPPSELPSARSPERLSEPLTPRDTFIKELDELCAQDPGSPSHYAGTILKNLLLWMTSTKNAPEVQSYRSEESLHGQLYTIKFNEKKSISIKPMLECADKELHSAAYQQKIDRGEASSGIRKFFPIVKRLLGSGRLKVPQDFKLSIKKNSNGDVSIQFFESIRVENPFPLPLVVFKSMLIKGARTEVEFSTLGKKNVPTRDFSDFLAGLVI